MELTITLVIAALVGGLQRMVWDMSQRWGLFITLFSIAAGIVGTLTLNEGLQKAEMTGVALSGICIGGWLMAETILLREVNKGLKRRR